MKNNNDNNLPDIRENGDELGLAMLLALTSLIQSLGLSGALDKKEYEARLNQNLTNMPSTTANEEKIKAYIQFIQSSLYN